MHNLEKNNKKNYIWKNYNKITSYLSVKVINGWLADNEMNKNKNGWLWASLIRKPNEFTPHVLEMVFY